MTRQVIFSLPVAESLGYNTPTQRKTQRTSLFGIPCKRDESCSFAGPGDLCGGASESLHAGTHSVRRHANFLACMTPCVICIEVYQTSRQKYSRWLVFSCVHMSALSLKNVSKKFVPGVF
jgi:hypothetical protein